MAVWYQRYDLQSLIIIAPLPDGFPARPPCEAVISALVMLQMPEMLLLLLLSLML